MKKFDSPHRSLEVCSFATPSPAYLNRSVILLLAHRCALLYLVFQVE